MEVEMLLTSGLEKQANFARRRAFTGDFEGATATYSALWPETRCLPPDRRIRFLGQYIDVLARRSRMQSILDFDNMHVLTQEARGIWNDLDIHQQEAQASVRHLKSILTALLRVARDKGQQSPIGQKALRHVWELAGVVEIQGEDSEIFRRCSEHGSTVWITRYQGQFRIEPCG